MDADDEASHPRAAAHLPGFVRLLEETPEWLARRWPRTTEYARTWRAAWRPTGSETETSLLSFALQEYEAASLRAKMMACEAHADVKIANLQHDGLVVAGAIDNRGALLSDMREACEHALGYCQPVSAKPMDKWAEARKNMRETVAARPEPEVLPTIPYSEAIEWPLFLHLDEPKRGGLPQRRGHEQLALKWAAKGLRVRR